MGGQVLTDIEPVKSYLRGMREGRAEGRTEGRAEGEAKGRLQILADLVRDGLLPVVQAAERAGMTPEEFRRVTGIR